MLERVLEKSRKLSCGGVLERVLETIVGEECWRDL